MPDSLLKSKHTLAMWSDQVHNCQASFLLCSSCGAFWHLMRLIHTCFRNTLAQDNDQLLERLEHMAESMMLTHIGKRFGSQASLCTSLYASILADWYMLARIDFPSPRG